MSRYARLLIPVLAAASWGCDALKLQPPPLVQRRKPAELKPIPPVRNPANRNGQGNDNPAKGQSPRYVFLVRIKVVTIEAPVGTISSSERVWSWLDEEIVGAEALINLGRNGFRIGVGRRDDWPAVAKMLKSLTGRGLTQTLLVTRPSEPVSYVVKQKQGVQTVFTFYPDRTCSGADYPPGDNLLTMACTFDSDEPQKLMIVGVPQIRTTRHRPRIVKGSGRLSVVDTPAVFTFDPLTFRLRFTGGDFLMIGPGVQASRAVTIGHHFLIKKKSGAKLFETILILIPEVVAAPLRDRTASLGGLGRPARSGD